LNEQPDVRKTLQTILRTTRRAPSPRRPATRWPASIARTDHSGFSAAPGGTSSRSTRTRSAGRSSWGTWRRPTARPCARPAAQN